MNVRAAPALPLQRNNVIAIGPAMDSIRDAVGRASARIAPLWPLRHFVAVNPWSGMTDMPFEQAAARMRQVAAARLTMPRQWYADAIRDGGITDEDLTAALHERSFTHGRGFDAADLRKAAAHPDHRQEPLPTVTGIAAFITGNDWDRLACERISRWAASYFDEGQTTWRSPWRSSPPFTAWREEALIDRVPELMGLEGFRNTLASLPDTADEMIRFAVWRLGIEQDSLELWFHRLLMTIQGWSGYARYRVWQSELHGVADSTLTALLAIRLGWEVAVHSLHMHDKEFVTAWAAAQELIAASRPRERTVIIDSLLHRSWELAWQRNFAAVVAKAPRAAPVPATIQLAFCIDVRSEPLRRALEQISPHVQTFGFAGFFGMPLEYVPLGHDSGAAHCPVLLKPRHIVCEAPQDASLHNHMHTSARGNRLAKKGWHAFKSGAVSSFGYVESFGWTHALLLVRDALGIKPAPRRGNADTAPALHNGKHAGRTTGLSSTARVELALNLLRSLSLSSNFSRLFVLTAHGATSTNNPHASSLDCGACGGHSGGINARVAVALLNDTAVRLALKAYGISIPTDTLFVAALHDTTCDTVTLFDDEPVPASHAADLRQLSEWLQQAGAAVRRERAQRLANIGAGTVDEDPRARSRDWSQVRPELGLANCAAFIVAPRDRTRHLNLGGRAFLHDYDATRDDGFKTLEQVMTAPMVVASWISLQYFGSTVDNEHFGSGNKTLHNIVSALGVLEGNGGDLRAGLPLQAVQCGTQLLHQPLRLSVFIEAPIDAIERVLDQHVAIRQLIDNQWLHLFALAGDNVLQRLPGQGWQDFLAATAQAGV